MLALSFTTGALLAGLILALVLLVAFFIVRALNARIDEREQDVEGGPDSPDIPATGLPADDGAALGSTDEVHQEVNPHDLPIDHPGRHQAEREAGLAGTTRGHEEGGAAGAGGSEEDDQDRVGPAEEGEAKVDR